MEKQFESSTEEILGPGFAEEFLCISPETLAEIKKRRKEGLPSEEERVVITT